MFEKKVLTATLYKNQGEEMKDDGMDACSFESEEEL